MLVGEHLCVLPRANTGVRPYDTSEWYVVGDGAFDVPLSLPIRPSIFLAISPQKNILKGFFMLTKNLCKFIPDGAKSELKTINFILETDSETQRMETTLKNHVLFLVKSGEGEFCFGQSSHRVSVGDMVFGFSGEKFYAEGNNLQYYYIGFEGLRAEELFSRFGVSDLNRVFLGFDGMLPFWQENISRATDQNVDLVSESVLLYTFSRLSTVRQDSENVAFLLQRFAEENFSDVTLSLQTAAEELGYNAKYLSTCFKKRMNMGFSEYVKTLRINNAIFLIEHGVESVKNVAFLSGFQDPLYFSKVFKSSVGQSPTEYIERLKKQS